MAFEQPVVAGVARLTQRVEEPGGGLDPVELMCAAALDALDDIGVTSLGPRVQLVAVPRGMWRCTDPARVVADRIGATGARTISAEVGVLQHSIVHGVCERVARGELEAAVVCGGEARYRHVRAVRAGVDAPEHPGPESPPDEVWRPSSPVVTAYEFERGVVAAPLQYALIHSALAHATGWSLDAVGELWSSYAGVAADDPLAWDRSAPSGAEIVAASDANRIVAFPYTRLMCSQWNVDQSAALVIVSSSFARELGVDPSACVYPVSGAESNAMLQLFQREDVHTWPAFEHAARAVLDLAATTIDDVGALEIYSCFPSAVQVQLDALGIAARRPTTVTGGMTFGGGPLNNFVLQAMVAMVQRLRSGDALTGLVTGVSGLLTKPGLTVFGRVPSSEGFRTADVSELALRDTRIRPVATDESGPARVIAASVAHDRGRPPRAVAVLELADGSRTLASSDEPGGIELVETSDPIGASATVVGPGRFTV